MLFVIVLAFSSCDALPFDLPFEMPFDLPGGGSGGGGGGGGGGGARAGPGPGQAGGTSTAPDAPLRPVVRPADVPMPSLGDTQISQGGITLDISNISRGYFMARYTGQAPRVMIRVDSPGAAQPYDYDLNIRGDWEVFTFTRGSGTYTITVFENVGGQSFTTLYTTTLNVNISDHRLPFLYPNQYVNFTRESRAVALAAELSAGTRSELDVVANIYNYIIQNITYDHDFATRITSGDVTTYVPDIDAVLARGRGICFDYSSLMAAMLRSQNIPTRIEIGFVSGGIFHAWVTIYTPETGWVGVAHFTGGASWTLVDPTFSSASADGSTELAAFIGDGTNYQTLFTR